MKDCVLEQSATMDCEDDVDVIGCLPTVLAPAHRQEIESIVRTLPQFVEGEGNIADNNEERYCKLLKLYQEQPNLLDSYIPDLVRVLLSYITLPSESGSERLDKLSFIALQYLEHLTSVRGAKIISRLLPHEVYYLERLLICLENISPVVEECLLQKKMLLLWLWIVCKNPFDMKRFDPADKPGSTQRRILNVARPYLSGMLSRCHYDAALVLSQCVARTDGLPLLHDTVDLCLQRLSTEEDSLGGLILLAALLKHVDRQRIISHVDQIISAINPFFPMKTTNALLRKFLVKTAQRVALTLLKPRIASWRYRRGNRCLEQSLSQVSNGRAIAQPSDELDSEDEDDSDVSQRVEWVIGRLLEAIKDEDTTVRWSAAKGIGRICSRLSKYFASQVVHEILKSNFHKLSGNSSWHGGCMALAELSRRGLLLPDMLPEAFEIVQEALFYEEPMGRQALGSNVRDAACYILWAFARAYEPQDLKPYVEKVATSLMCVTLFDREVRLRRAASAAFQENVGRQADFPDGIKLLTIADYYAVGNRERSFTRIARQVVLFRKYSDALIDHLIERKVGHWDASVRQQTATALYEMAPLHTAYIASKLPTLVEGCFSPNPTKSHGSILSLAYTISGLIGCGYQVPQEILSSAAEIPGKLKLDFVNQKKGELTRNAVTEFIRMLSLVKVALNQEQISAWLSLLEIACVDKVPHCRTTASSAANAFAKYYLNEKYHHIESVRAKIIGEIRSAHAEATRIGFCYLAAALPAEVVTDELFFSLCEVVTSVGLADKKWALARQAAVEAITELFLANSLSHWEIPCFETFFKATEDYTMDIHGDIGRYVRQQAMYGLTKVLVSDMTTDLTRQKFISLAVKRMIQQSAEKIGRTREAACNCISNLLNNARARLLVPHAETLADLYKDGHDFIQDKILLNMSTLFLCDEYYTDIIQGLILSAGGVSEVTCRCASQTILEYQTSVVNDLQLIERLVGTVADYFDYGMKVPRIGEAVLRFLPQMLGRLPPDDCFVDESAAIHRIVSRLTRIIASPKTTPARIRLALSAFSSLLLISSTSHIWKTAMEVVAGALSHNLPVVRRAAAESLLEAICMSDVDDEVLLLLSETPWQDTKNLPSILNAAQSIQNILVTSTSN